MEVDENEYNRLIERERYLESKVEDIISSRQKTKEEKSELKEKLTALEAKNSDLQNQLKQFESFNQKVEEIQKKILKDSVKEDLLSRQITELAKKHNAIYPNQISRLMNTKSFVYDGESKQFKKPLTDINGKIVTYQSLDDSVKEFLSEEQNDNLVLSNLKLDGMGNKRNHFPAKEQKKYSDEDEKQAFEHGLSIDDFLKVKAMKEAKIGRRL